MASRNNPTHYEVLQVHPRAGTEVVRAAYLRLAKKYHPDLNKTPDAQERMKELNGAYEILSDQTLRAEYDRLIGIKATKDVEDPLEEEDEEDARRLDDDLVADLDRAGVHCAKEGCKSKIRIIVSDEEDEDGENAEFYCEAHAPAYEPPPQECIWCDDGCFDEITCERCDSPMCRSCWEAHQREDDCLAAGHTDEPAVYETSGSATTQRAVPTSLGTKLQGLLTELRGFTWIFVWALLIAGAILGRYVYDQLTVSDDEKHAIACTQSRERFEQQGRWLEALLEGAWDGCGWAREWMNENCDSVREYVLDPPPSALSKSNMEHWVALESGRVLMKQGVC
jgi:hypothetical protein